MVAPRAFGKSSAERAQREQDRLEALESLDLLDTPKDPGFERIVRLIKEIFSVEIGIVSLIDAHRQWYQACSGLPNSEMPREDSFCKHIIDNEEPMVIQDATKDPRFASNPAVTGEAHVRFYAGTPLVTRQGYVIGTVCAIDTLPRSFGAKDMVILRELAGLAMDRIELLQSAATDSLTGALTRRAFKTEADQQISLAMRHQHDLACIMLDIDHFKKVNDTHGHAAGDAVLQAVTSACKTALRAGDVFGRLGGEEFAIILPHVDRNGVLAVCEKLRMAIENLDVAGDFGTLKVTASLGSSCMSIVSRDIETLLAQADAAMYRAKNEGRNRSIAWSDFQSESGMASRRRVLKAGAILFNERRSTIDCTIKSLGGDGAGIVLSNAAAVPPEFVLIIRGDGFETKCRVISQDRHNLEVAFG